MVCISIIYLLVFLVGGVGSLRWVIGSHDVMHVSYRLLVSYIGLLFS